MSAHRLLAIAAIASCAGVLSGCASTRLPAPVEDRTASVKPVPEGSAPAIVSTDPAVKLLPGAENAGKPGYYTVKAGDTLTRIGLETGQAWRDIALWNNLQNVNVIEVGQVLRVISPTLDPALAAAKGVMPPRVDARPLDPKAPMPAASGASGVAGMAVVAAIPPGSSAPVAGNVSATPSASKDPDDDVAWLWPAGGSVSTNFDENRTKGIAITGKIGDPVYAAADGRVVYAGSGLRGYGNLVIVKHNNTYLSAYAHNSVLLVKEDQAVRRGQKIAEMGSSDADRVQLQFEIRKLGKPIDPAKLLPPR